MAYYNSGNQLQTPPAVLNLIIINALIFFAQLVTGSGNVSTATDLFALHHYKSSHFQPYQVVTYMFMHANFAHIAYNMFSLWIFGSFMERDWGAKRFLVFYFICGIGAAIFQMGLYIHDYWQVDHVQLSADDIDTYQEILRRSYTVGASGAIMGVLAAFGYLYPNLELMLMFIPVPIKAKWLILGMFVYDIIGSLSPSSDNVAHIAHIGGAVIGFLIVFFQNKKSRNTFY